MTFNARAPRESHPPRDSRIHSTVDRPDVPAGVAPLSLTIAERIDAFTRAFLDRPASWPWLVREGDHDAMYAVWVIGQDYRNPTRFYGAYPHGYLDRLMALFPDVKAHYRRTREIRTLHVFSGSVKRNPAWLRLDLKPRRYKPEYVGSVYDVAAIFPQQTFSLVPVDPPYTVADAEMYGTAGVDRRRAMEAIATITEPGGFCAWLDLTWPMHRKDQWATVGRIYIRRSTNHHVRELTIFQRRTS